MNHKVISLGETISRVELDAAKPCPQTPLLWQDDLTKHILDCHYWEPPLAPFGFYPLQKATIFGDAWILHDGYVVHHDDINPAYIRSHFENGTVAGREIDTARLARSQIDRCFSVWNFNADTYGHWLIEGVPKLLVIRRLVQMDNDYASVPLAIPADVPGYVRNWIKLVLPNQQVRTFNRTTESIEAKVVLLPIWGRQNMHAANVLEEMDALAESYSSFSVGTRLFVSRRVASGYRSLSNLGEIERTAQANGFVTFYPEDYSLEEQIGAFANADIVVGEYGSALHNAIFSKAGTKVFALNWINDVQSRIGQERRHRVGYLLPTTGVPVEYNSASSPATYEISQPAFLARLYRIILDSGLQ
jgi:capsular polysaccharide biosynthesis protein